MQTTNSTKKLENLAILFDADNANPTHAGSLIKYLENYGNIYTIQAYANWTKLKTAEQWQDIALIYNIKLIQLAIKRAGKNAADIKLVTDGCKMANKNLIDGICIASNDSDYTPFIQECRNDKIFTIVAGGAKASMTLMKVCDEFIDERTLPNEHPTVHINQFVNETIIEPPAPKEEIQRRPREMKKLDKKILKKLRTRVKRKKI